MRIELQSVAKQFLEGDRPHSVLRDANATIESGEVVALLGRSGSGKSTILNLVSGIDAPDSGDVRIGDFDMHGATEQERTLFRRRHIGFVFQFFHLIPTLNVRDNLLLPLELIGRTGSDALNRADQLLERVGLADRAESFPDRLSGGEQQRIAIARALVHDPDVVLADEPTGNLDLETGRTILALLDELVRDAGKKMLLVTHSTEVAAQADRVLRIRDGAILEDNITP